MGGEMSAATPRADWPFGVELRRRRVAAGLSVKAAARRTAGAISDGRWYQLESGVQKIRGQQIPIGTTPPTVVAAARAVDWNVEDALTTAGFTAGDMPRATSPTGIERYTDDELLAEVRKRMQSPHSPAQPGKVLELRGDPDAPPAEELADAARTTPPHYRKGGDDRPAET